MATSNDNTSYIDEMYKYDCKQREPFSNDKKISQNDGAFMTGSAAEGAFICRGVYEIVTNIEMDIMEPFAKIPANQKNNVLESTNVIGYYRVKWNEELRGCLQQDFHQSLLLLDNNYNPEYLDGESIDINGRALSNNDGDESTELGYKHNKGTPNLFSDVNFVVHIEIDHIKCIELDFWPDFLHPWFERERYWPSPEIVKEIDDNKCHLVLKSTPGSNRNDEWRISFSKAEVILAKRKSHFQNKCYLLAKFMYYANLKQIDDPETGRHISSYLLKTTMLHMLEQTPPEHWKDWEERKSYCQVVIMLYERLAESLSKGYLPSYFVDEINLLEGYPKRYLKKMGELALELCKFWSTLEGEDNFHCTIKRLYSDIKNKMETPDAQAKVEGDIKSHMEKALGNIENNPKTKQAFRIAANGLLEDINVLKSRSNIDGLTTSIDALKLSEQFRTRLNGELGTEYHEMQMPDQFREQIEKEHQRQAKDNQRFIDDISDGKDVFKTINESMSKTADYLPADQKEEFVDALNRATVQTSKAAKDIKRIRETEHETFMNHLHQATHGQLNSPQNMEQMVTNACDIHAKRTTHLVKENMKEFQKGLDDLFPSTPSTREEELSLERFNRIFNPELFGETLGKTLGTEDDSEEDTVLPEYPVYPVPGARQPGTFESMHQYPYAIPGIRRLNPFPNVGYPMGATLQQHPYQQHPYQQHYPMQTQPIVRLDNQPVYIQNQQHADVPIPSGHHSLNAGPSSDSSAQKLMNKNKTGCCVLI